MGVVMQRETLARVLLNQKLIARQGMDGNVHALGKMHRERKHQGGLSFVSVLPNGWREVITGHPCSLT